jgi:hypothetical protein
MKAPSTKLTSTTVTAAILAIWTAVERGFWYAWKVIAGTLTYYTAGVSIFTVTLTLIPRYFSLGVYVFRLAIIKTAIESLNIRLIPPQGLQPYRGEEIFAPQWPTELCWRERKLLVGPPMPDRPKGSGQAKCSPWSSRLGLGWG